jgi:hypothetical protein
MKIRFSGGVVPAASNGGRRAPAVAAPAARATRARPFGGLPPKAGALTFTPVCACKQKRGGENRQVGERKGWPADGSRARGRAAGATDSGRGPRGVEVGLGWGFACGGASRAAHKGHGSGADGAGPAREGLCTRGAGGVGRGAARRRSTDALPAGLSRPGCMFWHWSGTAWGRCGAPGRGRVGRALKVWPTSEGRQCCPRWRVRWRRRRAGLGAGGAAGTAAGGSGWVGGFGAWGGRRAWCAFGAAGAFGGPPGIVMYTPGHQIAAGAGPNPGTERAHVPGAVQSGSKPWLGTARRGAAARRGCAARLGQTGARESMLTAPRPRRRRWHRRRRCRRRRQPR